MLSVIIVEDDPQLVDYMPSLYNKIVDLRCWLLSLR